jgi:hypothetical protein
MDFFATATLTVALMAGASFVGRMAYMAKHAPVPEGDRPRKGWTVAWVVWLVAAILGFFAIEVPALLNDSGGDTLTEHIQFVAGQSPAWAIIVAGGIVSFFAWFLKHLFDKDSRVWGYLHRK